MAYLIDNESYKNRLCPICLISFDRAGELDKHLFLKHKHLFQSTSQHGRGTVDGPEIHFKIALSALNGTYVIYKADLGGAKYKDIDVLFANARESATEVLRKELKKRKNLRLIFSVIGLFTRINPSTGETEFTNLAEMSTMRSYDHILLDPSQIDHILDTANAKVGLSVEEYLQNGSGWTLDHFTEMAMKISSYDTIGGSSFMELPPLLRRKNRSLLNIRNDEENEDGDHLKCFAFSVLAHPSLAGIPRTKENKNLIAQYANKVSTYKPHLNKLDLTGLHFPMTIQQIDRFQRQNKRIGITVIGYNLDEDDKSEQDSKLSFEDMQEKIREKCYPLYICNENREIKVDLLLLIADTNEGQIRPDHFLIILNLISFLSNPTNHGVKEICRNCLQTFQQKRTLDEHQKYCASLKMQRTVFPTKSNNILRFKNWERTIKLPFIIFADFECVISPYTDENEINKTTKTNKHEAVSYSWICLDSNSKRIASSHYRASFKEENICERFLIEIIQQCESLKRRMVHYQNIAKKTMTFQYPPDPRTTCFFCDEEFPDSRKHNQQTSSDLLPVLHHRHEPPYEFLGFAHNTCNLLAKVKTIIPVYLHNMGKYDGILILNALNKDIVDHVEILGKSSERLICITVNHSIKFMDSFSFFPFSLASLVETLPKDEESFRILRQEFTEHSSEALERQLGGILPYLDTEEEKNKVIIDLTINNLKSFPARQVDVELLLKKQSFPYSYLTSIEKFKDPLPPPAEFYNELKDEHISKEDYEHLQKLWKEFDLKCLGDLCDLYCCTDTYLLACVFEANRRTIFKHFHLDLGHYLSLPMLTKDSSFKVSKAKVELLTDSTKYAYLERSLRGGLVSTGDLRCAKSNNPYCEDYNKNEMISYISFLDMNSLYAFALSQPLPQSNFQWVNQEELERIQALGADFIMSLGDKDETGYFFEVDLIVPENRHDYLDGFPPAAIHRTVELNQLSIYQTNLMDDLNSPPSLLKTPRLIADLLPKMNYICHYRNLKYYLILGCKLIKIHKILSFTQSCWYKRYVEFNAKMRNKATTEIERSLWKLMTNSSFGKLCESLRKRLRIVPILDETRGRKYNKKPNVRDFKIVNEGLVLLILKKLSVKLNNPIAAGSAVLELSKLRMLEFYYEFIKVKYGPDARTLYSDTDSLLLFISLPFGGDIYEDFKKNAAKFFDMSKYDKNSPIWGKFYDDTNAGSIGYMSDELPNCILTHAIVVRPKVYIIRYARAGINHLTGTRIFEADTKKKAKGISKTIVEKQFNEQTYLNAMMEIPNEDVTMKCIRSYNHILYSVTLRKKSLSSIEIKRFCLPCGVSTLAYGNKSIKLYE